MKYCLVRSLANGYTWRQMDNRDMAMDAMQHLRLTRKITVGIFIFMVLTFFLICGAFGLVRRSVDVRVPQPGANRGFEFNGVQGRP